LLYVARIDKGVMDRNDLLAATREHFLRSFTDSLQPVIDRSVTVLFNKADQSRSSADERRFLDARTVLTTRNAQLKALAVRNLEQLLNRGFQTAYSTFRQQGTGGVKVKASTLSLVDVSSFEDELRIDNITQLFRDEADEELRDLNIRVALLFEQENIKERENPFRPYVLSRSIGKSAEMLEVQSDVTLTLIDQLCECLIFRVSDIYSGLNELLSHHGIAAELRLKIRKSAEHGPNSTTGVDPDEGPNSQFSNASADTNKRIEPTMGYQPGRGPQDALAQAQAAIQAQAEAQAQFQAEARRQVQAQQVQSQRRIDRLIDWVRGSPRAASAATAEAGDGSANMGPASGYGPTSGYGARNNDSGPASGAPGEGAPLAPAWLSTGERAGGVLRRAFLTGIDSVAPPRDDGAEFDGPATAISSARLTRSLHGLMREETPSGEEMILADGSIRNLIMEQRPRLSELTDAVQERMAIDIVAMLFEFILRDTEVPAEVRAQLGRLQFLVLKTALRDPTFFTHKSHPARMLVNRIGSISLSLRQVDPSGKHLTAEICRIVEVLLADTEERVELFAQVLDEFDQFVARELRTVDEDVERAVLAMESVESRTLQFARITSMIADGLSILKIDPKLHHFIVHTWAHVVERSGRVDVADSKHYRSMVPDLIWSIAPKVAEVDRKALIKMLPGILATMREGMTILEWDVQQQQDFLGWLIDSHTRALRAVNLIGTVPPLSFIRDRFAAFMDNSEFDVRTPVGPDEPDAPAAPAKIPEFSPALLADAIRELKVDINVIDDMFDSDFNPIKSADGTAPVAEASSQANSEASEVASTSDAVLARVAAERAAAEEAINSTEDVLARLKSGVAIEINLYGQASFAKLNWVSPNEASLVLTIQDRPKPSIISVRLFRWLLRIGRARFLEASPLFERAVGSLLETADEIDAANDADAAN
jgi:Protein of unknown function (DUF1631)